MTIGGGGGGGPAGLHHIYIYIPGGCLGFLPSTVFPKILPTTPRYVETWPDTAASPQASSCNPHRRICRNAREVRLKVHTCPAIHLIKEPYNHTWLHTIYNQSNLLYNQHLSFKPIGNINNLESHPQNFRNKSGLNPTQPINNQDCVSSGKWPARGCCKTWNLCPNLWPVSCHHILRHFHIPNLKNQNPFEEMLPTKTRTNNGNSNGSQLRARACSSCLGHLLEGGLGVYESLQQWERLQS